MRVSFVWFRAKMNFQDVTPAVPPRIHPETSVQPLWPAEGVGTMGLGGAWACLGRVAWGCDAPSRGPSRVRGGGRHPLPENPSRLPPFPVPGGRKRETPTANGEIRVRLLRRRQRSETTTSTAAPGNPKPADEAGVGRVVVEAVRRAAEVVVVEPRAVAQHPPRAALRPKWVQLGTDLVIA